jgi:GNAT superfamily N-acetyltransferase
VNAPAVGLRPALPADAEALARCQLDCWRETYTSLAEDPDRLAQLLADVEGRTTRWREILASPNQVLLAEDDGPVGFATAGAQREDGLPGRWLYALYVRVSHQGRGIGHRLLGEALGDAPAMLWVLRGNERAVRFYRQHGFAFDGTEAPEPHFGGIELRMVRPAG